MRTIILNQSNFKDNLDLCINYLQQGEVIAFPTETVYGLGCDFYNPVAAKKIFELKDRVYDKPLTAHISDLAVVEKLVEFIPEEFYVLADKFLPGPLTIILKKNQSVSDVVTGGKNSIGIRFPDNQLALELISAFGKPLAATSANISGQPPAITIEDIIDNFNNKIPIIIDGGITVHQIASTVIDLSSNEPALLREGAIPKIELEKILKKKLI